MKKKLKSYKRGGQVYSPQLPKFKFGIGSFAGFMKNGFGSGNSGGAGFNVGNLAQSFFGDNKFSNALGALGNVQQANQNNQPQQPGFAVAAPESSLIGNEYAKDTTSRGVHLGTGTTAQQSIDNSTNVVSTIGDQFGDSYLENTPGFNKISEWGKEKVDRLSNSASGGSAASYRGAAIAQEAPKFAVAGEKIGSNFGWPGRVIGGLAGTIVGTVHGALNGTSMKRQVDRQYKADEEKYIAGMNNANAHSFDSVQKQRVYKCGGKVKFKYGGEKPHSNNPNALVDHKEVMMNPSGEIQKAVGHNSSQRGKDDQIPVSLENGTRILSDSLGVGNRSFADMASNLSKVNSKARKVLDDRSASPIDRKTAELNLRASTGAFDKLYAAQEDQKMIAGIKSAAKFKYGGKKLPKYERGTEGDGTGNPLGLKLSIMDTVPQNQGGTIAPGTSPIRPYSDEFNNTVGDSEMARYFDSRPDRQKAIINEELNQGAPDWYIAQNLRFTDEMLRAGKYKDFSPGNKITINRDVKDFRDTAGKSKFYTANNFAGADHEQNATYPLYIEGRSVLTQTPAYKRRIPDDFDFNAEGAEKLYTDMVDEAIYGANTPGSSYPVSSTMLASQSNGANAGSSGSEDLSGDEEDEMRAAAEADAAKAGSPGAEDSADNTARSRELLTKGDAGLSEPTVDNSKSTEDDDDKTPGNEEKNPEDLTWEQLMNGGWEDPHKYDNEEEAYIRYHQAKANEPVEEINPRKYDVGKVTPGSYNRWSDDANLRKMQAAAVQTAASRGGGGSNAANAIAASLGFAGKQADIAAAKQKYDAAQIQEANRVNTEIEKQNMTNRMKVDEMNMRSRARREDHAAQAAELRSKLAQSRKSDRYKARKEYIDGLTQFAGAARYMNEGERKMYMDALNRAFSSTGPGGYNARVASGSNGPTYKMSDETKAKLKKGADKAKAGAKKAWDYTKGKFKKIGKSKKK